MPNPGDIIGDRFEIVRELGSGGFGTTYLVRDNDLSNRPLFVAKHLQPRFTSPAIWENAKERFATEAVVLQRLGEHPQIPKLIDHFEENQNFYLIQELIEGEELRREINRHLLSEDKVVAFLADALSVLHFVHQQNVIHRDIKPSNLLRRKDGKIVLIDFGAVKELETISIGQDSKDSALTSAIGTPGYMAPEQQNGKPIFSSDIYALGRTAMYALSGQSPLDLEATVTGDEETWGQNLAISPVLRRIVSKMTESNPKLRYSSALEVLQALFPLQQVGKTLGDRYRLLRYLGSRSWSYSYLAEPLQMGKQSYCVIKQVKPMLTPLLAQQEARQRFEREISVLSMLDRHPQIPRLLERFEWEGEQYLVQEYIDSKSLEEVIATQKKISESDAIELLGDVLEVLEFVHHKKIVHRDLRPSTLICQANPQKFMLTDFGLAKSLNGSQPDAESSTILTQPSGSDRYAAPEQRSGRPTYASDLYALGMTAIHGLIGKPLDRCQSDPKTGELLWQKELNIDPQLAAILDRLVQKDLAKRFSSASDARRELRQLRLKYQSSRPLRYLSPWHWSLLMSGGILSLLGAVAYVIQVSQIGFLFRQADLALQAGAYQNAVNLYSNGLGKAPFFASRILNFEKAWIQKAYALNALKNYPAMLEACEKAASIKKNSPYPQICRGTSYDQMDKPEAAIAAYNRAIAYSPELYEAWHNRGHSYLKMGKTEQAIADFKKAIAVGGDKAPVTWNDLGKLYFQSRTYDRAVAAYREAIALAPQYLPPYIGLGNALLARQLPLDAIEIYKRALEIDDRSYEAWFGKALAEERLNRLELALRSYERAIFIKPNYQAAIDARQRILAKLSLPN